MKSAQADRDRQAAGETAVSRRTWLRVLAAGFASTAGLGSLTRGVRASHAAQTPRHVDDPVFDDVLLEEYKPALLTQDVDVDPSSIHGFVVRSGEKDTTALCYWVEYPVQLDASGFASHIGDHEPVYVFLENEGTGDERIDRVVYSGYHWLAAEDTSPPTTTGEADGRPRFYVFPQYHHYSTDAVDDYREGVDLTLKDLTSSLERWLDDPDFHDALSEDWNGRGSPAYNPWLMLTKESWWRVAGLSNYEQGLREIWLALGMRGADGSDLT